MGWIPFWSKDSSKDEPKKRKLDQNEVAVKIGGGIGQARLSRLNTGETYRLTISDHLSAKIIGGQVGSFKITGATVIIQELSSKVIFSGQLGDLITIKDDNGVSTAVAEVGAGSRTEVSVEISKAKMLETTYKFRRDSPMAIVENCPLQKTQSAQIKCPVHAQLPVPILELPGQMEMELHKGNASPAVNTGTALNGNGLLARNPNGSQELLRGGLMGQDLDQHAKFLHVYNQLSAQSMVVDDEQRKETQSQPQHQLGQQEDQDDKQCQESQSQLGQKEDPDDKQSQESQSQPRHELGQQEDPDELYE